MSQISRWLFGVGLMGAILVCMSHAGHAEAQGPAPPEACAADPKLPAFELAAITPVAPNDVRMTVIGNYGQPHFTMRSASMNLLLGFAFGVQPENFIGAPHGLGDVRFDVQVQSADGVPLTFETLKPRMQQMLEQRFCLKAHTGTRQVAGYELVVAKGGAKVTPVSPEGERGSGQIMNHEVSGSRMEMPQFASMLGSAVGRPVRDATGMTGLYTMKVQFAPPSDPDSTLPSILTALKEQLGLELKPAEVSVQTLIFEHLNLVPTEN